MPGRGVFHYRVVVLVVAALTAKYRGVTWLLVTGPFLSCMFTPGGSGPKVVWTKSFLYVSLFFFQKGGGVACLSKVSKRYEEKHGKQLQLHVARKLASRVLGQVETSSVHRVLFQIQNTLPPGVDRINAIYSSCGARGTNSSLAELNV